MPGSRSLLLRRPGLAHNPGDQPEPVGSVGIGRHGGDLLLEVRELSRVELQRSAQAPRPPRPEHPLPAPALGLRPADGDVDDAERSRRGHQGVLVVT